MNKTIFTAMLGISVILAGGSEPSSAAMNHPPEPITEVVVPRGTFYFVGRKFADGMFQPFGNGFVVPDADTDVIIRIRCRGIQLDERQKMVGLEVAVRNYLTTNQTAPFAGVTGPTMFDLHGAPADLPPGAAVSGPLSWTRREADPGVDWWESDLGARLGRTDGKMVICVAKERGWIEERFRIHPAWPLFRWMFSPVGKDVVPIPERE